MNLNRLSIEKQKELISAFDNKDFATVREIILNCKPCMSGCGSCFYTDDLAAVYIKELKNETNIIF